MGDLKRPRAIYCKGFLFLFCGMISAAVLLWEHPDLRFAFLLGVAIWSFARFYYFAFYVIEHYVDGEYKFAGLWDFVCYLFRKRKKREDQASS